MILSCTLHQCTGNCQQNAQQQVLFPPCPQKEESARKMLPPSPPKHRVQQYCVTACIPQKSKPSKSSLPYHKSNDDVPPRKRHRSTVKEADKPQTENPCPVHGRAEECPVHGRQQKGETPSAGDITLHHMAQIYWQPKQVGMCVLPGPHDGATCHGLLSRYCLS